MKFLTSVGAKARPPGPVGEAIRRSTGQRTWQFGKPYTPSASRARDVPKFIADTYERVTWVFKATATKANDSARLPVVVRRGDPETGTAIKNHYLLPLLNWRTSSWTQEQAFVFRHRVHALLDLSSRGVFVELVRTNSGGVDSMHIIPPHLVSVIPHPTLFVERFEVSLGERTVDVAPERMLWIRRPHPLDPYRSMTPYEAAGIAIDTDWMAHVYNANFMRNDGRPGGLVGVKGGLEDDDADELKTYFSGGYWSAGQWRVIEADEITVADLSTTPRDAQYVEMRGLSKEEILMAAGVPESVAGNASGRTFDNADAEREIYWEQTQLPDLELMAGAYDLADNDPDTFVVHDTSGVEALQRGAVRKRAELRDEFDRGLITVDEYRDETGRKPFGEPESEVPYIGIGLTKLFSNEEEPVAPSVPPPPIPPPVPNGNGNGQGVLDEGDLVVPPVGKADNPFVKA